MTDDDRLGELFRTAASDAGAPPPRFDHADVVAASRRITARRRSAVVGAAVMLVLVGVGVAVPLSGGFGPDDTPTAAAPLAGPDTAREDAAEAGAAPEDGAAQDQDRAYRAAPGAGAEAAVPTAAAEPRTAVPPVGVPLGPATGECAQRGDPALRALLAQVLPEVATAPSAATTEVCLPGGDRYLALEVDDGASAGVLTVSYLQPGSVPALVPGASSAPTASGGTAIVASSPSRPGDRAPFEDRLPAVLEFLAPRL